MAWELGLVGAAISWGSRWAPSANGPLRLRALGLAGRLKAAGVPARWHHVIEAPPFNPAEAASAEIPIRRVATQCRAVRAAVASALSDGLFPVTLGGDHSAALGHYAALASRLGERGRLGILWIDAHADLNTVDTSPSGNVHGMPLAAILGHGDPRLTSVIAGGRVAPEDIHLLALRDVDRPEWEFIQAHGIRVTGMDAIRREGLAACLARAIEGFGPGIGGLGVSLDLDALTVGHDKFASVDRALHGVRLLPSGVRRDIGRR